MGKIVRLLLPVTELQLTGMLPVLIYHRQFSNTSLYIASDQMRCGKIEKR